MTPIELGYAIYLGVWVLTGLVMAFEFIRDTDTGYGFFTYLPLTLYGFLMMFGAGVWSMFWDAPTELLQAFVLMPLLGIIPASLGALIIVWRMNVKENNRQEMKKEFMRREKLLMEAEEEAIRKGQEI